MAENSGFFASVGGDRQYTTDFLADWVKSIISNGVYNGELAVTAGDGMTVKIPAGRAWINGYYYHNDSELTLTIDNADGVLNRIDVVVLRWDVNARSITAQVIKGTPASTAAAPAITRTAEQYDLKLAEISIPAGTTKITQSLITDTRLDNDVCGIVTGVIDQVDTTTLFNQYVDWYTTTTGQAETDIEAIKQQFQDNLTQFEQDWNNWFSQQQTEGFVMAVEKGQPNGIAALDENGKVPDEQLPKIEVPVTSVNGKTGDVVLTADDVGAETPAGAQAKASTAETNAKNYAETKVSKTGDTMTGILTAQSNTSYTVRQVRNIILSAADADVDAMQNGDIWIKYK